MRRYTRRAHSTRRHASGVHSTLTTCKHDHANPHTVNRLVVHYTSNKYIKS